MSSEISSRDSFRMLFRGWMRDMDVVLGRVSQWHPSGGFESILGAWRRVLVEPRVLVSWYRMGGHSEIRVCAGDPVWAYFSRCMGHHLDRAVVLGCPRVSVLCAWAFHDGRWRDCEGVLGGDHVACYLYAGVRGGLPRVLHSRLVMEGMVGKSVALCRYLMDFCGSGSLF